MSTKERLTPESDRATRNKHAESTPIWVVDSDFARSLEKQRDDLREALRVLINAVENHHELTEEDYDAALAHNFNATFGAVMESLRQSALLLTSTAPKDKK
jgi:hypothetical protein